MEEILYKHFRDEKVLYFQSSDAFRTLAGDTYLRYGYFQGNKENVLISIGSDQIDETPIKICTTPDELDNLIRAIVF